MTDEIRRRAVLGALVSLAACNRRRPDATASPATPAAKEAGLTAVTSAGVPRRALGSTGVSVSLVGIGGFHIGDAGGVEGVRIIRSALDRGVNFLDSCWVGLPQGPFTRTRVRGVQDDASLRRDCSEPEVARGRRDLEARPMSALHERGGPMRAMAFAFMAVGLCACRGSEPTSPSSSPSNSIDAGTTKTTSGVIDEPNSPDMTNSGTPNPPERGDPPQVLPPEVMPSP